MKHGLRHTTGWRLRLILLCLLGFGGICITPSVSFGQDIEPKVEAPVDVAPKPSDEEVKSVALPAAEPAPTSSAEPVPVLDRTEEAKAAEGAPTIIKIINRYWLLVLAAVAAWVIGRFVSEDAWKKIVRAGFNGVDQIYVAYIQPNADGEWDQKEARRRAWEAAKKQMGPILKLIVKLKGRDWGEALIHKLANQRKKESKQ